MDGNGRWAAKRGLPRPAGHKAGADNLRKIMDACRNRGIKYATFFAFSTENWKRPKEEVDALMRLFTIILTRLTGLRAKSKDNVSRQQGAVPRKAQGAHDKAGAKFCGL